MMNSSFDGEQVYLTCTAAPTPQKPPAEGTSLPPRGSLSTPRGKMHQRDSTNWSSGSGPGSGAPVKPPSARKSSASENLRGIAINFNVVVDIEARQSGRVLRSKAWEDDSTGTTQKITKRAGEVLLTPEPTEKRRLADLDDQQSFIRPIPLSFEPLSQVAVLDSPDPCSKFHSGPGPVPVSPLTPGAPAGQAPQVLSSNAFERFLTSQKMTTKQTCNSNVTVGASGHNDSSSIPLIYGSNVTMDSPDPCSKFHSGPGPVPVSPLTHGGVVRTLAVHGSDLRRSDDFMPIIYSNSLTVESPDPLSKFKKSTLDVLKSSREGLTNKGGNAVIEKVWRHSAQVDEAESIKLDKLKLSNPIKQQPKLPAQAQASHRVAHHVVSPNEDVCTVALFNKTVSPMKPNYEQMCRQITQGASKMSRASITVDVNQASDGRAARFARKVSPISVTDDVFGETLSPFKADYSIKCDEINSTPKAKLRIEFESPRSDCSQPKAPLRPCPPSARPSVEPATGLKPQHFRRGVFTGKDVSNVLSQPVREPFQHVAGPGALTLSVMPQQKSVAVTGGSGNFRRGLLKTAPAPPAAMTECSETDEIPLRCSSQELPTGLAQVGQDVSASESNSDVDLSLQRRRIRVSYLQCGYVDISKRKQTKKKSRMSKFDPVLISIPENYPTLLFDFPSWLPSVCFSGDSARSSLYTSTVRKISNDGVVIPKTSFSMNEDEQNAILESIESHELQQQRGGHVQKRSDLDTDLGSTSRVRRNLLVPLSSSWTENDKSDTYGLWLQKQTKPRNDDHRLFWACYNGDAYEVKEILSSLEDSNAGASLNDLRGAHGNTLLTFACVSGSTKIVKLCLRASGLDTLNFKNAFGNSPLHFTHELGYEKLTALLLRLGADPEGENEMGARPGERIKV